MAKKVITKMNDLREKTHARVDTVMDNAETLEMRRKDAVMALRGNAKKGKKNIDGYIRHNPEKAVLLSLGVGVIAGAVAASALRRRRHNSHEYGET